MKSHCIAIFVTKKVFNFTASFTKRPSVALCTEKFSTLKGLNKLLLNEPAITAHLDANWAVVAEAIQTILRREGYPNPYESLKELTRTNSEINAETIA